MTGDTQSQLSDSDIQYGFTSTVDDQTPELIAEDRGKPLPLYLVKLLKRYKIKQMELQKRKIKNRRRNALARKSRRLNRVLKHG